MAGISSALTLTDMMTGPLMNITNALNMTISAFESMQSTCDNTFDGTTFTAARGEIESANASLAEMERQIQENANRQDEHNRSMHEGKSAADGLLDSVKKVAAAYLTFQTAQKAIDLSDQYTQTTARLNLMNEKFHESGQELIEMDALNQEIFASAQASRGAYLDTANAVAKLGNNAGNAFGDAHELIDFMEQVNKQFVIGGASTQEQSNAMVQLSQAMAAGALRGEELNSILDAAPGIARTIEKSMGWAEGSIKSYAEEGKVTAQVVKQSLLDMADETNAKFESMPMTFGQVMTSIENQAVYAFAPVLEQLNDIANSNQFDSFVDGIIGGLVFASSVALDFVEIMSAGGAFIVDNWSVIGPLITGLAVILGGYTLAVLTNNTAELIGKGIKIASCFASYAHAAATHTEASATAAATAAQYGFNTAILACPLTWILIIIIAVIAAIYAVVGAINEVTGSAYSATGVICGGINVVIQFFMNLLHFIANVFNGIYDASVALTGNIPILFYNAITSVQAFWYGLLTTVLTVVEGICEALNKLPFIEFDYSGITSAADAYAAKAMKAQGDTKEYQSISVAFQNGFSENGKAFESGWVSNAWDTGYSWGSGKEDAVKSMFDPSTLFDDAYTETGAGTVADNIASAADNTSAIKDSVDITNENLKYLRDIAETEVINRFTTAEIKVDQTNYNTVNSGLDIDGMVTQFTEGMNEAMEQAAEGVHN